MKKLTAALLLCMLVCSPGYCKSDGFFDILQAPNDVSKTKPTDGQVLQWIAAQNLWVPSTVGISGATSIDSTLKVTAGFLGLNTAHANNWSAQQQFLNLAGHTGLSAGGEPGDAAEAFDVSGNDVIFCDGTYALNVDLGDAYFAGNIYTSLGPNLVVVTNGSGMLRTGGATSTEISYVTGVTSAIQTQLDSKKTIATGNNYSFETTGAGGSLQETSVTGSRAVATDANGLPTASATTATELGYVNGVTSAIQTQINGKQATGNYITALTTDVTASGPGSVVATIANAAVTYAKFQIVTGLSLTGVTGGVAGSMGAITANTADNIMCMNTAGTAIGWTSINLAGSGAVGTSLLQPANGGAGVAGPTRTAAAVTNATATVSAITGLTATVTSNTQYVGMLVIFANNSTAIEGLQFDFGGGTATIAGGGYIEFGFAGTPIGATLGVTNSTALATAVTATTATTGDDAYYIPFTVGFKGAGTFIPRFAEVSHTAGTATAAKGCYMIIFKTGN